MIYHTLSNPPKKEGLCDNCGKTLLHRDDDNPLTVKNRLKVYNDQTLPLLSFYEKKNLLHSIEGNRNPEVIKEDIIKLIQITFKD